MRVQFTVSRAGFGEVLGAMREWLDRRHCTDVRFETAAVADLILITVELPTESLAAAFRDDFEPLRAAA